MGLVPETTELLQKLIRNRCVNDGSPDSGQESRNAELLASFAGSVAYGSAIFSDRITFETYHSMPHGDNERMDQESLGLTAAFCLGLAEDLLSASSFLPASKEPLE